MPDVTHEGNDPMGAPTSHRGPLENCPAPDCQDRIAEQQDQTSLREHIALAMHSELTELPVDIRRQSGLIVPPLTDAVLRTLPPPVDRAAVLMQVADGFDRHAEQILEGVDGKAAFVAKALRDQAAVWQEAAETLRRMAAEAQPEAPWATDSARIGRALIWSWASVSDTDFGQGYRTAQEDVRSILTRPLLGAEAPAPETQTALKRAHVALAEQAGRDQAAIKRVLDWAATLDAVAVEVHGPGTRHPVADHIRELLDTTGGTADSEPEAQPVQHAPGRAILCPDCRDKGHSVCMPDVPVHAVPLPGSNGISACCGRPPCEFVGERVTRDPDEVTCTGPAAASAGVQPDTEATP